MSTDNKQSLPAITLAAIGVVYGDIGTSPLYTLRECLSGQFGFGVERDAVFGFLSLIFWLLILVVSVKYLSFVMRADNAGEGGILTLMSLAGRNTSARMTSVLVIIGLIGGSFFYGEVVITPAISVLSAIEGLEIIAPQLDTWVVPLAIIVLTLLFVIQKHGTGLVGKLFAPIMLAWFLILAALGLRSIIANPEVLHALNPYWAVHFFLEYKVVSFVALGAVVLSITGVEALYADMGHFGRLPIRIIWVGLVLPSLVLNYFGQGALLLDRPEALSNLFYLMAPASLQTALIILATVATVIASQAVISGTFSMTRQAIQLGFLPRLRILQTSADEIGQIYLPFINSILAISVAAVILIFQSSNALGSAYGIAVTGTMLITDFLAIAVAIHVWKWQPARAFLGAAFFILMDGVFFSANTLKLFDGGWFPIMLSIIMIITMTTWYRGIQLVEAASQEMSSPLVDFIRDDITETTQRVQGSAIYLVNNAHFAPIALKRTLQHFSVVHETVAVLSVHYAFTPYVDDASRVDIQICDKGFLQIRVNSGFMETTDIPAILKAHWPESLHIKADPLSYILKRIMLYPNGSEGMALWRKKLFSIMYRNAALPLEVFKLPDIDGIAVGIRIRF